MRERIMYSAQGRYAIKNTTRMNVKKKNNKK